MVRTVSREHQDWRENAGNQGCQDDQDKTVLGVCQGLKVLKIITLITEWKSGCLNIFFIICDDENDDVICVVIMGRVKRIWYLSPMRAAKVQASLRIRAVSPEPPLLAHTSSESRGTVRQKTRSLAPLNGWAWASKICHDGMLEDTNLLDGAHINSDNHVGSSVDKDGKRNILHLFSGIF